MGQVKIIEHIYEVTREIYFDSFEDFMEYERVNNSRVEEKKLAYNPVVADEEWTGWHGDSVAPVECDVIVEVKLRNGETMVEPSEWLDWSWGKTVVEHYVEQDEETCDEDIIAYRIVEEEK